MSAGHEGRCLCNKVSYDTGSDPLWFTICYCRFCQHATGSDRLVEPIFERASFSFGDASPSVYTLPSKGSGKNITIHFCSDCGTKLALSFERWPDRIGIFAGTLDDPSSMSMTTDNTKHIFVSEAQRGTILPAGVRTYDRHATENDGSPCEPTVYDSPHIVGGDAVTADQAPTGT